jgi:lipopolysaccharide transport system ATP-binding protein
MSKSEIRSKFDEIVAFSGVERYIDTPVKRYSSGMYVRLAFAVAAHLEPEILVIDEVLAVGDAEFQKKCLGKMKDVSSKGRTVLFVSHNMGAVSDLCTRALILQHGTVYKMGSTNEMVKEYVYHSLGMNLSDKNTLSDNKLRRGSGEVRVEELKIYDESGKEQTEFEVFSGIRFRYKIKMHQKVDELFAMLALRSSISREFIGSTIRHDIISHMKGNDTAELELSLDPMLLNEGVYEVYFWLGSSQNENPYDVLDNLTAPLIIKNSNEDVSPFTGFTLLKSEMHG